MEVSSHARVRTLACGGLSGLLLAAATAQIGLGPLCFAGLVPLFLRIDAGASPADSAAAGGLAGAVFFGFALGWVPAVGLGSALIPLLAIYVLALASTWALFGAALAWLRARDRAAFFVAGPLIWIVLEYLRAAGWFGYPWHHLGYALADHPRLIQLAALGGVHAVSLWIVAVNASLVAAYSGGALARATACALVLAPLTLGARNTGEPAGVFSIAAIQPAAATSAAADRASFDAQLRDLVELSDRAVRSAAPDLVVEKVQQPFRDWSPWGLGVSRQDRPRSALEVLLVGAVTDVAVFMLGDHLKIARHYSKNRETRMGVRLEPISNIELPASYPVSE